MLRLTSFQAKLLAQFFSDIARGALLSALGFSVVGPLSLGLRIATAFSGTFIAFTSLSWALEIAKEVKE